MARYNEREKKNKIINVINIAPGIEMMRVLQNYFKK